MFSSSIRRLMICSSNDSRSYAYRALSHSSNALNMHIPDRRKKYMRAENERPNLHLLDLSRSYSLSKPRESLVVFGIGLAVSAVAGGYVLEAYKGYSARRDEKKAEEGNSSASNEQKEEVTAEEAVENSNQAKSESSEKGEEKKQQKKANTNGEEASNPFSGFFNMFGKNFYEGGFEDKMTKREAALILGVRESATIDRIKDAHRRILLNNHPDRGGSPYVASKVNEAKDLLMKTKST